MTSSPDTRQKVERLPPGLSSMWRLCKLGYRHEPGLLLAAFSLALLSALPDSLIALWFKLLGDGALARNWSLVVFAAVALGRPRRRGSFRPSARGFNADSATK